jgi:hypothetical protein
MTVARNAFAEREVDGEEQERAVECADGHCADNARDACARVQGERLGCCEASWVPLEALVARVQSCCEDPIGRIARPLLLSYVGGISNDV